MAVYSIEGINQSGKTSVAEGLGARFGSRGCYVKLPYYPSPFGRYILDVQLKSKEERPLVLRVSPRAQMALYAANRLEVTSILESAGGISQDSLNRIIFDRSPYSNFFTYVDVLLDGAENGFLEEMVERGEITEGELQAIVSLMSRWTGKGIYGYQEIPFSGDEIEAIRTLYSCARGIIEELDAYFLRGYLGEGDKMFFLDLPAVHACGVEVGEKHRDVQEGVVIQRIVREMYTILSCDRTDVVRINQFLPLATKRRTIQELIEVILQREGFSPELRLRGECVDLRHNYAPFPFRDVEYLREAWAVIDGVLPIEFQREVIYGGRITGEGNLSGSCESEM